MQIFDISQPLHHLMITYPESPTLRLQKIKNITQDDKNETTIACSVHTGSHVDCSAHFFENGKTVEQVNLSQFFGASILLDFTSKEQSITLEDIKNKSELIKENDIVLLKTKNSLNVSADFQSEYIYLTADAAQFLIEKKIKAIGIDGVSIDKFNTTPPLVHKLFMKVEIPIYMNLHYPHVNEDRYMFYGFPLKIEGAEASPIRAILTE